MNTECICRAVPLLDLAPVPIWIPATWGIGLDFFSASCDMGGEESRRGSASELYVPPKKVSLELDDADRLLELELLKLVDMEVFEMENSMAFSAGGPSFELEDTCLERLGLPQDMTNLFEVLEAGASEAASEADSETEDDDDEKGDGDSDGDSDSEQGPCKRVRI